uniref:Quattro n=1 Tax=Esox lucius TaxID=8010 RepID=A0A6Q2YDV5_ESOLU
MCSHCESLDSSIQSALSALFPPFEATAPTVLSQLFRTIEERYQGDALHCLLDFLIPSKHLLESVQQAACAAYSDVLFRCEGWPLCLHDRIVVQLAPLNPLLLRPGDFYLQVEPFGEQASRIVLKSLLEEGCREVEETPIPETSYPCIFTLDWLREVNDGRHSTPLSRCLLSTDQGVMKVPWAQVAVPEFLDKPKAVSTASAARGVPFQPRPLQIPSTSESTSSALSLETMILPGRDGISVSLRLTDGTSKLIKGDHETAAPKPRSKPLIKPVGWVSPNTWDTSRSYREMEGDYVDLVEFSKEKQPPVGSNETPNLSTPPVLKPVRPPPPVPRGNSAHCGRTLRFSEEPCSPCSRRKLGPQPSGEELKCRYRDSYLAALRNPVPFDRGSVGTLSGLDECDPCEGEESCCRGHTGGQVPGKCCGHFKEPVVGPESNPHGRPTNEPPLELSHTSPSTEPATAHNPQKHTKEHEAVHKLGHVEPQNKEFWTDLLDPKMRPVSEVTSPPAGLHLVDACESDVNPKLVWNPEAVKTIGKHKGKLRSLSTVSEKARGSPPVYKLNNRSHSDICKEMIPTSGQVVQCRKDPAFSLVSPKLRRRTTAIKGKDDYGQELDENVLQSPDKLSSVTNCQFYRDKAGRAVLEVHGDRQGWTSPLLSAQEVCTALLYLHSIPRKDVRSLGLTVVIDARNKPPPSFFYKALLMVQEHALHAVHSLLLLVDKDTSPRPERHPGLQMDVVTSLKALHKLVEGRQLTSDLGGTFPYSHSDWMQFQQVALTCDLIRAEVLALGCFIVQDVQLCIQDQKTSMKDVLQDARLVTLQREGGATLARMRREEFRFANSDDYRDALESVTVLYNQVEERVHTLVMRSNESLQHLDVLLKLREAESNLNAAKVWFDTEGEQQLNGYDPSEDTLESVNQTLQRFASFLSQAKKNQQTLTLMMEVEKLLGSTNPERDVFQIMLDTLNSKMADFLLRAEQRRIDLENTVHVYRFCEEATALAQESRQYLEEVETGRCSAKASLNTLTICKERLADCFSARHFQNVKAKAGRARGSGGMRLWNAAWIQCRDVSQRLGEALEQWGDAAHKDGQQPTTEEKKVKMKDEEALQSVITASSSPPCQAEKADNSGSASCSKTEQQIVCLVVPASTGLSAVCRTLVLKLQRIMEELLMTEREYVRSLGYVREHYFAELDRPDVPQDLRGQRGSIFGNLEKLHDFHHHHFLKELEGCLQEPFRVGRCFLRHSESFGLYALYSKNKPQSDSLLVSYGYDFFKKKQLQLGDKMDLSSYLLKPVQRISKYSLLLQDMVKECGPHRLREKAEVQHALEVIQFQLRHGNNLLAMDDIQDCDVNLKEQGQLIRQDEFLVSFRKKKCFRHIFLFQELVLFSKTKKTDVGNDTYVYKQSFKTSDLGMTHNSGDSGLCFEIWFRRRKSQDTYTLQAVSRAVKEAWTKDLEHILWDQAVHNREIRMQERVFMGIGNKPFMDIQPSDAAINDRAVNWTSGSRCGFPVTRPNTIGSGSCSSSFGSHSSSSSGRGSLSPLVGGYLCGPKQRGAAGGQGHPVVLEEDDMDQERGSQNLLSEWI